MVNWETLHDLAGLRSTADPIVSLMLDVDGRRRSRTQYIEVAHQLDRRVRESPEYAALPPESKMRVTANLDAMTRYIGVELDPTAAKGIALFACAGIELWQVVTLPCPLPDEITLGTRPYIRPLARAMSQMPRTLAVLVDREKARLFQIELGSIDELPTIAHDVPGRIRPESWYGLSDSKIERHVDAEITRHLRQVAVEVAGVAERLAPKRVVTCGTVDLVTQLRQVLPSSVGTLLAGGITEVSMLASAEEILRKLTPHVEEIGRIEESGLLRDLAEAGGPHGRAVSGPDCTFEAIHRGAVRLLAVSDAFDASGYECSSCGRLFTGLPRCPACEDATPTAIHDIGDAAISATLRQFGRIQCLQTPAGSRGPGIGALLRFHTAAPLEHPVLRDRAEARQ